MIATDVAGLLTLAGVGPVFIDRLPATPNTCIALFERPGPQGSLRNGYRYPQIQLLVRGDSDPRTGRALAESATTALEGYTGALGSLNCVTFQCLQSSPEPLGPDESGRLEYSVNFEVMTATGA